MLDVVVIYATLAMQATTANTQQPKGKEYNMNFATITESDLPTRGGGRPETYPWDEILAPGPFTDNGEPAYRVLSRGEHFDCEPESMRSNLSVKARERGLRARTRLVTDPDTLVEVEVPVREQGKVLRDDQGNTIKRTVKRPKPIGVAVHVETQAPATQADSDTEQASDDTQASDTEPANA